MFLIRKGLFISKNVIKYSRGDFFQRGIVPFNTIMRQESNAKNVESEAQEESLAIPKSMAESFSFMDPDVILLKNMDELQNFILKKKNTLGAIQIVSLVQRMHFLFYEERWSVKKRLEIKNSIEFHVLLGSFKSNLHEIDADELVAFLIFFSKLDIPHSSQLMQDIKKQLISNINDVSFTKSAMLYNYFIKQKIKSDLQELLKINIDNFIRKFLKMASDEVVCKAAYYASTCDFSVDSMIEILNVLLFGLRPIWNETEIIGNCFKILSKVKDHEKFPELEKQFFEILDELKKEETALNNFCHFIYVYGNQVSAGRAVYKENLVNEIIDLIMEQRVYTTRKLLCLEGLTSMKHVRHDFIRKTKNSVLMEKEIVNSNGQYFSSFVRALAESSYFNVKPKKFDEVKKFVEEAEIYMNGREMKKLGFDKKVSAIVDLLSMGIYPLQFFDNMSKEVDNRSNLIDFHGGRMTVALLINEALSVFRTPYKRNFLSEQNFYKIIQKLNTNKSLLFEERQNWLSDVKKSLESSTNQKNCMLQNCRTKHGQEIHFVIAVNELGDVFNFQPTGDKTNIIENIEVPPGYNLVLVNFVPKNSHNRNIPTVGSFYTLKLKILKALGYRTLTVLHDEWTALSENERGDYFWGRVKNEKTDPVFLSTNKFVGNDIIIEKKGKNSEDSSKRLESEGKSSTSESESNSNQWVKLSK